MNVYDFGEWIQTESGVHNPGVFSVLLADLLWHAAFMTWPLSPSHRNPDRTACISGECSAACNIWA